MISHLSLCLCLFPHINSLSLLQEAFQLQIFRSQHTNHKHIPHTPEGMLMRGMDITMEVLRVRGIMEQAENNMDIVMEPENNMDTVMEEEDMRVNRAQKIMQNYQKDGMTCRE